LQKKQDLAVLQTNGSGVLSFSSVSSDYVLLATTDVTASTASVSFDGYFSATYKNYKAIFSNFLPVNNDVSLRVRFRKSNADVTTSNYRYGKTTAHYYSGAGNINSAGEWDVDHFNFVYHGASNSASFGGANGEIIICNPLNTSSKKSIILQAQFVAGTFNDATEYVAMGGILNDNNDALSGITFYVNSGNVASGNFKLYGIK
jgi:hypothetical protein